MDVTSTGMTIGFRSPWSQSLGRAVIQALYFREPDPLDLFAYWVSWADAVSSFAKRDLTCRQL